jgi:hypothetical protein
MSRTRAIVLLAQSSPRACFHRVRFNSLASLVWNAVPLLLGEVEEGFQLG